MLEEAERQGLQRGQKLGVMLLSIFAIFAIGLGFLQIRNTMYAPFALNNGVPYTSKDDINTNEALIYRDTDKDGLNDFDELYVYITSPYLADTDSDGMDDKTEVEKGTSPICAEGKDCSNPIFTGESLPITAAASSTTSSEPLPPTQDLASILNNPTEIRKALVASGFDKAVLDQMSDEDLMKVVTEILNSSSTPSS